MKLRQSVLAALAGLLLAPAAAAAAPDTVIGFEGMPANTEIENQYTDVGVVFGPVQGFGLPRPERECPLPRTVDAGITAASANIGCIGGKEFDPHEFSAAFEFSSERRAVRFKLSNHATDLTPTATVRAYAIGGVVLEQRTFALARNAVVDVAFSRPAAEIALITVTGPLDFGSSSHVLLDDIVAARDDVPPPPKFSLALATPSVDVVEGSVGTATVSIRRFNGSTGPVNLSVGALPPGIRATQFTPNPVTGRDPATLRITADSPLSGQRQITVNADGGAAAGTAVGTTLTQSVNVVPAVQIPDGGRFPIALVPGCGPQVVNDGFTVRGGYTSSVSVFTSDRTGGATVSVTPGGFGRTGDGTYPLSLSLDPGDADGSGHFNLNVRPFSATDATLRLDWRTDRVAVDHIEQASVTRSADGTSRPLGVVGNFPPRCPVTFVDGAGQTWPITARQVADRDGRPLERDVVAPPAAGVSGPLRVLSPTGAELARTARVEVRDFRNTHALSGANSGPGAGARDFTWGEFVRVFGTDDTDSCFFICVHDPVAVAYYDRYRDQIKAFGGLCGGWSIMALRFRGAGQVSQPPSTYSRTASRAFDIAPLNDGTDVKRDIVRWQVAQNDKRYAQHNEDQAKQSAADERREIRAQIAQAGAAMLALYKGTSGHAVVAYAAQDTATGGLSLSIYDPNVPYSPAEETSADTRNANLKRSTITIDAQGNWTGSSLRWSGPNDSLRVLGPLPSSDAELPDTLSVASLLGSSGEAPPATVTSIRTAGRETLAADGTGRPGSGVVVAPVLSGVAAEPNYQLRAGAAYQMTVRGERAGHYDNGLIGQGTVALVDGATTAPGQQDRLTLHPGAARLGFATSARDAPVAYDLAERDGHATRFAVVRTTAAARGKDEVQLVGGTLRLAHDGPRTTVTVTLGSAGGAAPGTVVTAPLKLGRGERLELRPRSWSQLSDGVRVAVRAATGRVLRHGAVLLVPTKAVALGALRARRHGPTVTVSGRVIKPGTAPLLAATVELVRGRHVERRRTVTRRGRAVPAGYFSLPVAVGVVPRGTRLRATVALYDEDADLATVRRVITVHGSRRASD